MKNILFALIFVLLCPVAKASTLDNAYFFGDGKGYDINGQQIYYCFGDGSCYGIEGNFAFTRELNKPIASSNILTNTVTSSAPVIDIVTANRVKSEINSRINELNIQVDGLKNKPFDIGNLDHTYTTIKAIETNPGKTNWNSIKEYTELQNEIISITNDINQLNIYYYTIEDYLSTGIGLTSLNKANLKSLGINW